MDNAFYQQLVAKSACGILTVDREGQVHFANQYAHAMFGYSEPELIGANIQQLLPEEYRAGHNNLIAGFFDKEHSREMGKGNSFPALHSKQHIFYISVSLTPTDDQKQMIVTITETTKHQRKEEVLQSQARQLSADKEQLVALTKQSKSALFVTDGQLNIILGNEAFSRLTGQLEGEFQNIVDLTGRNTSLLEIQKLQQACHEQQDISSELLLYNKSGKEFWAIIELHHTVNSAGAQHYMGSLTDITEQKYLERRLIETSNLQRAILNSAPILLLSTNEAGTITLSNACVTERLGYLAVDLVDQLTPFDLLTGKSLAALKVHLDLSFDATNTELLAALHRKLSQQSMSLDLALQSAEHQSLDVELTLTAISSSGNRSSGTLWLARDITEQRAAEREVSRINQLLEATGEIAKLGAWELDLETNRLWWSDEVYRIHEIPIGTEIDVAAAINFYAPEAQPVIEAAIAEAIQNGSTWDEQLPFITAKNNRIWVRAVGFAEYKDGHPVSLRGAFQDITDIKRVEQKALAANQAKSEFLANMSHEIRTPLNGVLGINQLLAATQLDAKQREYNQLIAASGRNLLAIIDDILDVSKIEAGKLAISEQPLHLRDLFTDIENNTRAQLKEKSQPVRVELSIDDNVPSAISTDPNRLRQIILNLISNAIKCTDMGMIGIHLSCNKETISFAVSDTGIGIPEAALDTLFDKFTQVDQSSSRSRGGTGLGLSICEELAKLLGGDISVASTLGKGTTFTLTLPLKVAQIDKHTPTLTLVVCSDVETADVWREFAATNNLQVEIQPSAPAALQWIKSQLSQGNTFRVIIYQDLVGMAGIEFIKTLMHKGIVSADAIAFVDGNNGSDLQETCNSLGVNACYSMHQGLAPLTEFVQATNPSSQVVSQVEQTTQQPSPNSEINILLVEDNHINQFVTTEMLTQLRYNCCVANNGLEALTIFETEMENIDIILMDCQMPEMDGYETTKRIRQMDNPKAHNIPIIAITANARDEDVQACLNAGMNMHISKPLLIEELKHALEQVCQRTSHYDI